jgi:hypothetical protein
MRDIGYTRDVAGMDPATMEEDTTMTRIKLQVPVSPAWQRALARAAEDRKAGIAPERIACATYRIASTRPDHAPHTVVIKSVVRLEATCDCEGATNGRVCRHMAQAWDAALTRIAHSDEAPVAAKQQAAPAPVAPRVTPEEFASRFARM